MQGVPEKAPKEIAESLGDIKNTLQSLCLGMEEIRRDLEVLKNSKGVSAERVSAKLDRMLMGLSRLTKDIKDITPPGIIATHEVKHPADMDTAPQEMFDELTKAASEIQGEIEERCAAFGKRMAELTENRDSIQCLADYMNLLQEMKDEIVSRRNRIESLKERKRKADKDSNEQKNASILLVKVRSMIEPLERFSAFVLDSYFKKRKRIVAEVWRTTSAIETMYDNTSKEFKETIPAASASASIASALKELSTITHRHVETNKANQLVMTGNMSALERRKVLAALGAKH